MIRINQIRTLSALFVVFSSSAITLFNYNKFERFETPKSVEGTPKHSTKKMQRSVENSQHDGPDISGNIDNKQKDVRDLKAAEHVSGAVLTKAELETLAKTNITGAIEYANSLSDKSDKDAAFLAIVAVWAKNNPTICYDWIMASEDGRQKRSLLIQAMTSIAESNNPELLFSLINMTPKGELKDFSIFYVFGSLAKYDMTHALEMAKNISSENVSKGVAEKLAIMSIQSGISNISKMLDEMPYGLFRDAFVAASIDKASKRDPGATFQWVNENPKLCDFGESMMVLSSAFARNNPEQGLMFAEKIADTKIRDSYVQNLGASWAYQKPVEAGKWLFDRIQDTDFESNRRIGEGIVYQWVQWDHEKALAEIGSISDLQSRDQAMIVALRSFSNFDPSSAAQRILPLLTSNSPENLKTVSELTSNWMRRDPLAASNWVGTIEQGPLRDASISSLVENILSKDQDYKMANTWAAQIASNTTRNAMLEKIQRRQKVAKK